MGSKQETVFGPFQGVVTSVDSRYLQPNSASDTRNVRLEDGKLSPRYGYRTLSSAPTGTFNGVFGFDFTKGWNASGVAVEEYLSLEDTGSLQPYSIHPLTGARTLITHSGSPVSIASGVWHARAFDTKAYAWAIGGSAYEHLLGDSDNFRKVDTTDVPNPASGAMFVSFTNTVTTDPSGNPDGSIALTGAGSGTISAWFDTDTASAYTKTFKSATASSMTWDMVVPVDPQDAYITFRIDFSTLSAGNPDLSGISKLRLKWTHAQGSSSLKFTGVNHFSFISSGGSALDIGGYWTHNRIENKDGGGNLISTESTFELRFPPNTPASSMALLASTRYIEGAVAIYATGTAATRTNVVWHLPETWGGAPAVIPNTNNGGVASFGYAFYKSGWQIESEQVRWSDEYYMDNPSQFYEEEGLDADYLGNSIVLYADPPSGTGDEDVDQIAFYFKSDDGIARLIEIVDYAASGYTVPYSYIELLEGARRNWQAYRPVGPITWAIPYGGAMVWFRPGAKDNVDVSAVGEPVVLWNATQTSEERGVRTSMSPALDDEPVWGVAAGESLIALGSRGAYASVGLKPILMTPFKKLPGSKGVIGPRAAARWKDENGNPGVAYIDIDQEVWFAVVTPGFNGEQGFVLVELSQNVRGLVRSFLTQTDTPLTSALSLAVDERTDSLWLTYLDRALVLRRPSIVTGQRQWEQYDYATLWTLLAEDPYYGLRCQTASGLVSELERNSASSFAAITGSGRDAGTPIASAYWTSKVVPGPRRRVRNVRIERDDSSSSVGVDVMTDRADLSVTVPAGKKNANVGHTAQGESVQFRISMAETDPSIAMMTVEEVAGPSSRRDN